MFLVRGLGDLCVWVLIFGVGLMNFGLADGRWVGRERLIAARVLDLGEVLMRLDDVQATYSLLQDAELM